MFTVAPNCQIMEQLGLKGSSRKLHAICVISFFYLYLILYACVQTFDVTWWKILPRDLNSPLETQERWNYTYFHYVIKKVYSLLVWVVAYKS